MTCIVSLITNIMHFEKERNAHMQFNPVLTRSKDATNIMHFEKERNAHPLGSQAGRRSAILSKSAKHVTWAFPTSFPRAPHVSSASTCERPPSASGREQLPSGSQRAGPAARLPTRERARASSPRDCADAQTTRPRFLTSRARGRPEEAAPLHAACALPAPTSCASSLVPSRACASLQVHGRRRLLRVDGRQRLPPGSRVCLRVGNEPMNEKFTRDYG
jgi:hypothetical protein